MLYLNKADIESLINYDEVIQKIEYAMETYEKKDFVMPDRISATFKEDETYLYMPCFTDKVKGTKILTLYANNPKINEAVIQGIMILNDTETGKIKCVLDGASVTAYRTGAVGATGIKYTSKESCQTLGIIGTGVQGFYQALYASSVRNIKTIYVFDLSKDKCQSFIRNLSKSLPHIDIFAAESSTQLVEKSEIIVTVTPSPNPVIPDDAALIKNKHFIGIGSYKPTMREYPESVFKAVNKMYIDVDFAKEETGDLITPLAQGWIKENQVETLFSGISNKNIDKTGTTFYKSVGMALFDVVVADYIYNKAIEKGIGQNIIE